MQYYCKTCGRMMDEDMFYTSFNREKYPNEGKLPECKKCRTLMVDNWDPSTYMPILEEIDVPYIKEEWDVLLNRYGKDPSKLTGMTILGRYLSKMHMKQYKDLRFADTEREAAKRNALKTAALKSAGMSTAEIEEELARDHAIARPEGYAPASEATQTFVEEPDDFGDSLTEEDKVYLKLKWGKGYRWDEFVRLEQLYNSMMESYDIQTAGHKDYLIMICKTSLKANQLLDIGDVDGFQKMSKAYDMLMKSSKFTAAQNKEESGEAVDSVGEIVAICEKQGFIPRYYVDGPQDRVDRVLEDMQKYTHDLVTEELGLGNLIENAVKQLERERQAIADAGDEKAVETALEEELFDYDGPAIEDADFAELKQMEEEMLAQDQKTWRKQGKRL